MDPFTNLASTHSPITDPLTDLALIAHEAVVAVARDVDVRLDWRHPFAVASLVLPLGVELEHLLPHLTAAAILTLRCDDTSDDGIVRDVTQRHQVVARRCCAGLRVVGVTGARVACHQENIRARHLKLATSARAHKR